MKQIDFHYHVSNRSIYACKLVKKVSAMKMSVALFSSNAAFLQMVYDDLWRFEDMTFIPHAWADSEYARDTNVLFTTDLAKLKSSDVLILLDDNVPENWEASFEKFDRIVDIVGTSEEELQTSRARFRLYKSSGVTLKAYDRSPKK